MSRVATAYPAEGDVPRLRLMANRQRQSALPAVTNPLRSPAEGRAVEAYLKLAGRLMEQLGEAPSPLALHRCLLILTQKYREARRLAPSERATLEDVWDLACAAVEEMLLRAAPPPLEPPAKSPKKPKKGSSKPAGTWFVAEEE